MSVTVTTLNEAPFDIFAHSGKGGVVEGEEQVATYAAAILKRGTVLGLLTASGNLVPVDKSKTDGSESVYAILAEDVDARTGAAIAAVYYTGEFNRDRLIFLTSGNTYADHRVSARKVGIFFKPCVQGV